LPYNNAHTAILMFPTTKVFPPKHKKLVTQPVLFNCFNMLLYKNHEQMHQFSTQLIYFTHKMSSNDALSSKILHLKTLSHTCAVCYANHYVDHGCEICWCWVQLLLQDLTMAQHDDISICQQLLHLCYQPLSKLRSTTLLMDLREATSWGVGNLSCEEVWAE